MPGPSDEFLARAVSMSGQANHRRQDVVANLAAEMLRSFGEFRFVAWGSSMVPSIFPGDTLIVRPETPEGAHRGDIVLFVRGGRFYAHRLVNKAESGPLLLIARGDALGRNDPPFAESEMLGRVAAVVRGRKRIELDRPSRCGSTTPSMGCAALGQQREMVAAMAFRARAVCPAFRRGRRRSPIASPGVRVMAGAVSSSASFPPGVRQGVRGDG